MAKPKCKWGRLKSPAGKSKRVCKKRPGAGLRKARAAARHAQKG